MKKIEKDQISMGKKDKEAIDRYFQSFLEGPKPRMIELLKAERIIRGFLKEEIIDPDEKTTKTLPTGIEIISEIYDMTRPGYFDGFLKKITDNVTKWLDSLLDEKYKKHFDDFKNAETIDNLVEDDLIGDVSDEKSTVCLAASYGAGALRWLKNEAPSLVVFSDLMTSPGFKEFYICYNELLRMHQKKSGEKSPKRERNEEIMEAIQELGCDEESPLELYEKFRDKKRVGQVIYMHDETDPHNLKMGLLYVEGNGSITFETFRKYVQQFKNENEIN